MPRKVFRLPGKDWFVSYSYDFGWGFETNANPVWLCDLPNAMPLLPLLEMPWPTAAEFVVKAKRAVAVEAEFPFDEVLATALDWETQHWPSLAVEWLEQGFSPSASTVSKLQALATKQVLPQRVRHRATALLRRLVAQ